MAIIADERARNVPATMPARSKFNNCYKDRGFDAGLCVRQHIT
jgi:hypothetical protein